MAKIKANSLLRSLRNVGSGRKRSTVLTVATCSSSKKRKEEDREKKKRSRTREGRVLPVKTFQKEIRSRRCYPASYPYRKSIFSQTSHLKNSSKLSRSHYQKIALGELSCKDEYNGADFHTRSKAENYLSYLSWQKNMMKKLTIERVIKIRSHFLRPSLNSLFIVSCRDVRATVVSQTRDFVSAINSQMARRYLIALLANRDVPKTSSSFANCARWPMAQSHGQRNAILNERRIRIYLSS